MANDDNLRFPIGPFHWEGPVSADQRAEWITQIAQAPVELRAAVEGLTDAQLDTPYRPGGWTVRQVVHHLADSHMNSFIRFKLALTEEEPTIKPYDEAAWAELPDSASFPLGTSLALLESLHERWTVLLKAMTEAEYERAFYHPESKAVVPLALALGNYAWHGKHHTAHITRLRERMSW